MQPEFRSDVDFVLTYEELMGIFEAKEIDFSALPESEAPHKTGHGDQNPARRRPARVPEAPDAGEDWQARRISARGHGLPGRLHRGRRHDHLRRHSQKEAGYPCSAGGCPVLRGQPVPRLRRPAGRTGRTLDFRKYRITAPEKIRFHILSGAVCFLSVRRLPHTTKEVSP